MAEIVSPQHYLIPDRLEFISRELGQLRARLDEIILGRPGTLGALDVLCCEMLQEMQESPVLMLARIVARRAEWQDRYCRIKHGQRDNGGSNHESGAAEGEVRT